MHVIGVLSVPVGPRPITVILFQMEVSSRRAGCEGIELDSEQLGVDEDGPRRKLRRRRSRCKLPCPFAIQMTTSINVAVLGSEETLGIVWLCLIKSNYRESQETTTMHARFHRSSPILNNDHDCLHVILGNNCANRVPSQFLFVHRIGNTCDASNSSRPSKVSSSVAMTLLY